jgi:hypothetical protein
MRRSAQWCAGVLGAVLTASACSSGGSSPDAGRSGGKVTLSYGGAGRGGRVERHRLRPADPPGRDQAIPREYYEAAEAVFALLQRQFVQGIAHAGVKG